MRKRRQPAVAVVLDRRLEADRVGALDGNLDELVLAQRRARALPELLPVDALDEAVLRADVLQARDRHVAVALEDVLDELAGLLLDQRLELRVAVVVLDEDVAFGRQLQHVHRRRVGELVALLRLEVDGDLLVEVVEALDDAEAPRAVQDERAGLEAEQLLQPDERHVERLRAERHAVHKRKKKAIFRRLLQGVADAGRFEVLCEFALIRPDELEGSLEVSTLRTFVQLHRQRFRISHL